MTYHNMNVRTLSLIIILAIMAAGLTWLAIYLAQNQQVREESPRPSIVATPTPVEASAKLYFLPETVASSSSSSLSTEIWLDAGKNEISGVQIELKYDPSALSNVVLKPADDSGFFGPLKSSIILFNSVDQKQGRVSFAMGIGLSERAKRGVARVATLSFTKRIGSPPSTITFLPTTQVTQLDVTSSVLKETKDLMIQ